MPNETSRPRLLTLDDIYHPDRKLDFDGKSRHTWTWKDEEHYLRSLPQRSGEDPSTGNESAMIGTRTGEVPLCDPSALRRAIEAGEDDSGTNPPAFVLNCDATRTAVLATRGAALYRYSTADSTALRICDRIDTEVGAQFSPDGRWISWVRDNDIHVADAANGGARRLTRMGSSHNLVGRLDWVYQEEIYGRGTFRGYWWSPDSGSMAFLELDVSGVTPHTLDLAGGPETYCYPRAGSPNPAVRLGIIDLKSGSGPVTWADLSSYEKYDGFLVVDVAWDPTGNVLTCQVQDREQRWLELSFVDPRSGARRLVIRETSPGWVRRCGRPHWMADGSFIWVSDRTGWSHIYRYDSIGRLDGPVTSGEWDVREIYGVEIAGGENRWIYFSATERSPISLHTYRIGPDGKGMERLTPDEGTHVSSFSPGMTLFIDTSSQVARPAEVRLHRGDGTPIRQLESCTAPAVSEIELGATDYFQVDARDGFRLEAMMIKPPDFDPNRKYPVLCHVYGGPMTPLVKNAWGGPTFLWHHMIASRGAIVWVVDSRTASAKGIGSAYPVYRRFGQSELGDLEDSLLWLRGQRYIDGDRIAIWGWSFGGYLTAYAMTHTCLFRAGIAGAPVTDWTLYDTVYTERHMQTPDHNPEGYRSSSIIESAAQLHGKLLILHGTKDDNVHLEHTMRLVRELQRAGKDFDLMLYPGARHGIDDPDQLYDARRRMTEFILENL